MASSIVIDNGSGVLKAGISGENIPAVKFPAIVGVPRSGKQMIGVEGKSHYVGDEAQKMRGVLNLSYPIESGIVTNWDDMEKIWEYCFNHELRVDSSEQNVMLTEAPGNPKANREKMAQVMFETFKVPGLAVSIQAVLSLYSNGRTTGLVVDSGDGVTHTVPVFEGFQIPHAVNKNLTAGREITKFMVKCLNDENILEQGGQGAWFQVVATLKEKICFVAQNFEEEHAKSQNSKVHETQYELPDGSTVVVNAARFLAPEALFEPSKIIEGSETLGMGGLAVKSVQACDLDVRKDLYANIILSGGSTLYPGLPERLEKDILGRIDTQPQIKIIAPPDRYYSVWAGGSVLSSLATYASSWMTMADYEENGAAYIHKKFT